jgi:hypothetical protein
LLLAAYFKNAGVKEFIENLPIKFGRQHLILSFVTWKEDPTIEFYDLLARY